MWAPLHRRIPSRASKTTTSQANRCWWTWLGWTRSSCCSRLIPTHHHHHHHHHHRIENGQPLADQSRFKLVLHHLLLLLLLPPPPPLPLLPLRRSTTSNPWWLWKRASLSSTVQGTSTCCSLISTACLCDPRIRITSLSSVMLTSSCLLRFCLARPSQFCFQDRKHMRRCICVACVDLSCLVEVAWSPLSVCPSSVVSLCSTSTR